jgi:hypothetical protein
VRGSGGVAAASVRGRRQEAGARGREGAEAREGRSDRCRGGPAAAPRTTPRILTTVPCECRPLCGG